MTASPDHIAIAEPKLITVVIPALNAAETLPAQLDALATQTYRGAWEVVVSDNGSIDGTPEFALRWAGRLPDLRVVDATGGRGRQAWAGAAVSRNAGAAVARGDFLAFCDADDVVGPGWLEAMARAASRSDLVRGRLDRGAPNGAADPATGDDAPEPVHGFLPFASSSNLGIRAKVFRDLGGWNEAFRHSEDKELSWRVQLAGYRMTVAPSAVTRKRSRSSLRGAWRQAFLWTVDEPQLYRTFREHGMPRSSSMTAAWCWIKVLVGMPYLVAGRRRRTAWVRLTAAQWGRLVGSIRHRAVYL